ncbi:MAG: DUF2752 domain-containing protein [Bacteroidales bacterium]|nr:DUF2752 domain-containing protein [Bacteroidales bacterium]
MFLEWLEHHLLPCPIKHFFGIECPGCGMQRSIIELLKGNILDSIMLYPPLIPMIILFAILIVNLKINSTAWLKALKYTFIANLTIIFTNYIFKFI